MPAPPGEPIVLRPREHVKATVDIAGARPSLAALDCAAAPPGQAGVRARRAATRRETGQPGSSGGAEPTVQGCRPPAFAVLHCAVRLRLSTSESSGGDVLPARVHGSP